MSARLEQEWKGKSKGLPIGYQIFVGILRVGGLYPAYFLLLFVAFYYFLFSSETSRWSYAFFRARMGYSALKARFSVYLNYFSMGQALIDKVVIMSGISGKLTGHSNGAENLHELVQSGKGGILLGAHLGNWEIAGHFLLNYKGTVNIVMYENEEQQIKQYMDRVTGGRKYNVIPVKTDLSHVYAMSDALGRGEIICMHADRFVSGSRAIPLQFMGAQALFPAGPFQLVKSLKAPFTFVYGLKSGLTHYEFYARPIRKGSDFNSVNEIAELYVRDLETMVKQHPVQWFNFYDFWKKPENHAG
ncbi:MAG: lysophospholipid acyltransferase family protein [Chitinophagales bacterium]